jgi:hypothetical protein
MPLTVSSTGDTVAAAENGGLKILSADMLMLDNIATPRELRDGRFAVMVVEYAHVPRETVKFLGEPQSKYEKKNCSSVMLFNNELCKTPTPDYVNSASGLELHQFRWLEAEGLIGALPDRWNHLVGFSPRLGDAALFHYTLSGPYFEEHQDCEYAQEWRQERDRMLRTELRRRSG